MTPTIVVIHTIVTLAITRVAASERMFLPPCLGFTDYDEPKQRGEAAQ
jgi:hypothetical protein